MEADRAQHAPHTYPLYSYYSVPTRHLLIPIDFQFLKLVKETDF